MIEKELLAFEVTLDSTGVDKGANVTERALDDLGDSYDRAAEMQGKFAADGQAMVDRMRAVERVARTSGVAIGRMPPGLRSISQLFKTAATSAAGFSMALIGITLGAALIKKIKENAEKAKEELAAMKKEARELSEGVGGASVLVDRYAELQKKASLTKEETAEMNQISQNLVSTYGMRADAVDREGRLLITNTDEMREQLKIQRELNLLKLEETESRAAEDAARALREMIDAQEGLDRVKAKIEELKVTLAEPMDATDRMAAQGRANMQRDLAMLERTHERFLKAISDGQDAIAEQVELSMLLAVARMGDEIDGIPAHVQSAVSRTLKAIGKEGELPSAADAEAMLRTYLNFDAAIMETAAVPQVQALRARIVEALAEEGDSETSAAVANGILAQFTTEGALAAAFEAGNQLAKKISEGTANAGEMAEFDQIRKKIALTLKGIQEDAEQAFTAAGLPTDQLTAAFKTLGGSYTQSARQMADFAARQRAADTDTRRMTGTVSGLSGAVTSLNKEITDLADLQYAIEVIKEGATATEEYAGALDYLAERYGITADQVADNIEEYERDYQIKQALLELNYILALQEAITAKETARAMVEAGTATEQEAARMIAALDGVLQKLQELGDGGLPVIPSRSGGYRPTYNKPKAPTRASSGSTQSYKNEALEKEMALIERKKRLDQITAEEEIALLWGVYNNLAKTTEEREKLYDQIYAAQKALNRKGYDDDVYYGRLTLEKQRERIKAMIKQYKEGTDARAALERELYDIQQEIRDRDISELNRLADGVVSALRGKYEAQREAENETINRSIEEWRNWAKGQVEAINEQIKALDELTKQEDRAEEETRRRRKIAALEQQRQYETDAYNQRKLDEQIAKEKDDLNKWLLRNEREDQKKLLQEQADAVRQQAEAEQDALEKQRDDLNRDYDERLKEHNLEAEAEKLLMTGTQKEIIDLIRSFAPDYNAAGKDLGERLFDGFNEQAMDIAKWLEGINLEVATFQQNAANAAANAAAAFWGIHGTPTAPTSPTDPGAPQVNLPPVVINFYDTPDSPAKFGAEVERVLERISRA